MNATRPRRIAPSSFAPIAPWVSRKAFPIIIGTILISSFPLVRSLSPGFIL